MTTTLHQRCSMLALAGMLGWLTLPAVAAKPFNVRPDYLGFVTAHDYDGKADDLLTGGLGKSGLAAKTPPPVVNPLSPTAAELRRLAIYNNYRALVDVSSGGGYGVLFGPNVDINGADRLGEGKIAGHEFIAYSDDGSGQRNVTMMVQVPDSFDPAHACIIAATSSGSRGVYGAIGTAGEWGLKHGCAVAYTDKGTGNGVENLDDQTVTLQDGLRADVATAGHQSSFSVAGSTAQLAQFSAAFPHRFAIKHMHSGQNPEKDWGLFTLQAIEFAFYEINQLYAPLGEAGLHTLRFTPANTITIASSVSNGAGAALAAAGQDSKGLISGVAVAEPSIQLVADDRLSIVRGNGTSAAVMRGTGKSLLDYFTLANLLQPCAALVNPQANVFNTINPGTASNRCEALQRAGLIHGDSVAEQAASALKALHDAGWQSESDALHAAHYSFATLAVTLGYANAYGRFSVIDNLCNYSYAGATPKGDITAVNPAALAAIFGSGNGIPPTTGIAIINNAGSGPAGAASDAVSTTAVNGTDIADYNTPGALCLRNLVTGNDARATRVQAGIEQVRQHANLHGKPAIIVHGRSDTLIPVAFTSRPFFGLNHIEEGSGSQLSLIEVTNAQHFDAFLGFPGFNAKLVPLHRYFTEALDLMYAHLRYHTPLPDSQVVRTTPRGTDEGGAVRPISVTNVPPIAIKPAVQDRITFAGNVVHVPD